MRSVSSSMTPQQSRRRPSGQSKSKGASGIVLAMLLLAGQSVIDRPSQSVSHSFGNLGMGSTPYFGAENRPALQRLAGLMDLNDDEDNDTEGHVDLAAIAGLGERHAVAEEATATPLEGTTALPSDESEVMEIEDAASFASEPEYVPAPNPVTAAPPLAPLRTVQLADLTEEQLALAMQFVSVPEVESLRVLSKGVDKAADWLVQRPFSVTGPAFVPWDECPAPRRPIASAPPVPFVWRCVYCAEYSDNHQFCVSCGTPIDKGACRVFLGQLRKQNAAESVMHVLRTLLPGVVPLHIESHSNRSGHEKGCAWAYMNTVEDCHRLIALNKTLYFDNDGMERPGFWIVSRDERLTLSKFAEERQMDTSRSPVLPRQPLVAEFPMGSVLRASLNSAASTLAFAEANEEQWQRTDKGWYVGRDEPRSM